MNGALPFSITHFCGRKSEPPCILSLVQRPAQANFSELFSWRKSCCYRPPAYCVQVLAWVLSGQGASAQKSLGHTLLTSCGVFLEDQCVARGQILCLFENIHRPTEAWCGRCLALRTRIFVSSQMAISPVFNRWSNLLYSSLGHNSLCETTAFYFRHSSGGVFVQSVRNFCIVADKVDIQWFFRQK